MRALRFKRGYDSHELGPTFSAHLEAGQLRGLPALARREQRPPAVRQPRIVAPQPALCGPAGAERGCDEVMNRGQGWSQRTRKDP